MVFLRMNIRTIERDAVFISCQQEHDKDGALSEESLAIWTTPLSIDPGPKSRTPVGDHPNESTGCSTHGARAAVGDRASDLQKYAAGRVLGASSVGNWQPLSLFGGCVFSWPRTARRTVFSWNISSPRQDASCSVRIRVGKPRKCSRNKCSTSCPWTSRCRE